MTARKRAARGPSTAIALIRVSKVGDRGDDLLSPDLQRTAISGYAEQRGIDVIQWVEALDESGSQRRSPWWRRLDQAVQRVEDGEVGGILVWKYSRAARWRRAWAVALDRVETVGGFIESATEQTDTTTSTGRLARGMLAEMAAWEAEVKGEQWREVHASRLARGLPATGKPRWGYTYDRAAGFTPNPDLEPIIRSLYERFVQGDTHRTLARWLNDQGTTTAAGNAWVPANLATYMDGGFAAGLLRQVKAGISTPGAHQPIITPALWADYQRVRETTRRQAPWVRQPPHPLGGLIRCGVCGQPACRSTVRRHRADGTVVKRFRYRCCLTAMVGTGCPGIEQHIAYEQVKEWLRGVADDVDARAHALTEQRAAKGAARIDIRRAQREVDRLDEAIARLAVQSALLPDHAYAMARDELLTRREGAVRRLDAAREQEAALSRPAPRLARSILTSWDDLVDEDPKGLRDVLAALIARVEIHPGNATTRGRSRVVVVPRWEG